jgi:hypothetical protein
MKQNKNNLKKCAKKCISNNSECSQNTCEYWINFKEDHNCDLIAIDRNGPMTLRQIGERLGISYVRVKQIEDAAIRKIRSNTALEILED